MSHPRDRSGRFNGERVNAEAVPAIPAFIARTLLMDPRRIPLVLLWVAPDDPHTAEYVVGLAAHPQRNAVVIAGLGQPAVTASVVLANRRQGGTLCTWRCPNACGNTRSLFTFGLRYGRPALSVGCMDCLRLTYGCQGGAQTPKTLLRRLIGVEPGTPLPRDLLIPDIITADPERDLKKFRNIAFDLA